MTPKPEVILYYPDTGENVRMMTPPLGPLAIGAYLEQAGYGVRVFDCRVTPDAQERLLAVASTARMVGISALTGPQISDGLALSRAMKARHPQVPVVWGGWHPTLCPEQTASHPDIDYVVRGPGEITVTELLATIAAGGDVAQVAGLAFRRDGQVKFTAPRGLTPLDELPSLGYHLVDLNAYPGRPTRPEWKFTMVRAMQGCAYHCRFCAEPLVHGSKFTRYSTPRLISELRRLRDDYGIREVGFVDSNFLLSREQAREICGAMVAADLGMQWQGTVRIGTIAAMDDDDLRLLAASGCNLLHPGVEAASPEMMAHIGKEQNIAEALTCARKLKLAGIRGLYSFIVAFPGEPLGEIAKVFALVKELKEIDPECIVPVNFYTPYPRNALYEEAIAHGFREPQTLEEWSDFSVRKAIMPWVTPAMEDEVMMKDKYYLPAAYPSAVLRRKMAAGGMRWLYRVFNALARWRVTTGNYRWPLDWRVLLAYWRFWGRNNRRYPWLPNIHFRW